MDPVTHSVIGIAISAFSGSPVGMDNPATIGCMVGAVLPDIDFVVRIFKGDLHYLKHHRGITHSLPMLILLSAGASLVMAGMIGLGYLLELFAWTFIGALSHTAFDILNSYGAKIFKKKRKLNLLALYDPVISAAALFLILKQNHTTLDLTLTLSTVVLYLFGKSINRKFCEQKVREHFKKGYSIESIRMMPSLKVFYKWDFVISSKSHSIVGKVDVLSKKIEIIATLRNSDEKIKKAFEETELGKYFGAFTPNYHLVPTFNRMDNTLEIKAIDLRYHFKNEFMHHASLVVDQDDNILESYFRPYKYHRKISVAETA